MLPSAAVNLKQFHYVSEENPDDSDISHEELGQQLTQIVGWWKMVGNRFLDESETPAHALGELKMMLLKDTISKGVVSAAMLTIAQAELSLKDSVEAHVSWRLMKQVHVICWCLCFAANMLCLYLSTTEYLYTVATHPKDILLLLSKRYPPGFADLPGCSFDSWMKYLKMGKLDAFKRGFQTMVPGLLSGVYLRCDWKMTIGPLITTVLTCLVGWITWHLEMHPKRKVLRPATARARTPEAEAHLEPCRNSRNLCLASAPRATLDYAPLLAHNERVLHGLTDCAIRPFAAFSSSDEAEGSQQASRPQRHACASPERQRLQSGRGEQLDSSVRRSDSAGRRSDSGSQSSHSGSEDMAGSDSAPRLKTPPRWSWWGSSMAKRRSASQEPPPRGP